MPTATYKELLIEILPQVIETQAQYNRIVRRFGDLVGKGRARSRRKPGSCACWPCWWRTTTDGTRSRPTIAPPPKGYSSSWSIPARRQRTSGPFSDSAVMCMRR